MLSALITSQRGYPTMLLAEQLVHQWLVHPGPLVLGTNLFNFPTPTEDRDRTVSRRSEPSSRTALNGEQPYPWDRLQPQDAMSRHRGAKPPRRCELLGEISLLSPAYLLSFERWPFHAEPPDHYIRLSTLLDLYVSQSSTPYAIALYVRLPSVLRVPLKASDTFLEATTPVKLPTKQCPPLGVRLQINQGWYFKADSTMPSDTAS